MSINHTVNVRDEFTGVVDITQISKLLLHFGFSRSCIEISNSAHEEPLADTLLELGCIQFVIVFYDQIQHITEDNSIRRRNQFFADIASLSDNIDKAVPVVQVHNLFQGRLEYLQVFVAHFIREFPCFKVFATKQHIRIPEPSTPKANTNSHTDQVRRFNSEKRIVRCIICWDSGSCRKLVDLITSLVLIDRNKRLDKVVLRKALSARVYAHENISHILLICVIADFKRWQGILRQVQKGLPAVFNRIFLLICQQGQILFHAPFIGISYEPFTQSTALVIFFRQEDITDTADPFCIFFVSLRPYGKFSCQRVIGNLDFSISKVLILNLHTVHSRNKSSQTLLTVNNQFFGLVIGF